MLDERTQKYFKSIKSKLGFLGRNNGYYGLERLLYQGKIDIKDLKKVDIYSGYANSSDIDIYRYVKQDGSIRFCAEFGYQTDIDDYNIEMLMFDIFPSQNDVEQIREILSLEFKIEYDGLKTEFNCFECGKRVHWLDNKNADFDELVTGLMDRYCGC